MSNLKQGMSLLVLIISVFLTTIALALPPMNPQPFIAADVGYRDLDFDEDYGGNVFKSSLPQTGVQIGLRLWDYFGFQFGYERTRREGRTANLVPGDVVLGRLITPAGNEVHTTEAGIQGQHFDLLCFIPTHPMTGLELLLGLGVVRTKLLHKDIVVAQNNMTLAAPLNRTFRLKQTHYRVFGGVQKLFDINSAPFIKQVGIRGIASYENTNQHENGRPLEIADSFIRAKNSYVFSAGVVFMMG